MIEILGSAKGAQNAFKDAGLAGSKFGKGLSTIGKSMAVGLGGVAAGAAVIGKKSLDAAVEAQKVQKQVEQIIKRTGGAAGISAKQVDKLAESMMYKTGIDDEAIKTSMSYLLTAKGVRNEQGKGNQIFDRASMAALDLGKVYGSTDAAAKALGKALTDPTKGVTALKRAGVSFTEAQKTQIKALQESGDLLGAQKIILGEVEGRVGGVAEKTATAGDKMKVAFGEVQEKIGKGLLPIAEKLATWISEKFIPAVQDFFKKHGPSMKKMFQDIADKIRPVFNFLGEKIPKAVQKFGDFVKNNTGTVKVFVAALGVLAVVLGVVAAVLYILSINPIVLIIIAIGVAVAALAAGIKYLYDRFEIVRTVLDLIVAAWKFQFDIMLAVVKMVFAGIKSQVDNLIAVFSSLWRATQGLREGMVNIFVGVFEGIKNALRTGYNSLIKMINPIIKKLHKLPGLSWLPVDGLPEWPGDSGSARDRFQSNDVTMMATGGIVTKPTLGMVGEAGPEAVIPLSKLNMGGGSTTINVTVNASPLSSPADVGLAVVDALKAYERRNGSLPLKVA